MSKARILLAGIAVGLFCLTVSAPASAVDFGSKLSLHGYGNWSYARTDGNSYVNGNDEGSWDTMEFSLGITAEPVEHFSVHAQAFWEMEEDGAETSMDFAFAEYAFSPALALRAGKVKQPVGIYTEIFDVGVLFPFNNLAQGIYGPSGFVAEAYMGVGVTGALDLGGLRLQYDLYGGELESALSSPWAEAEEDEAVAGAPEEAAAGEGAEEGSTDVQDLVGGRIQIGTADGSYNAGFSAYTGGVDTKSFGEEAHGDRHTAVGAHAEAMVGALTLRVEYAYQDAEIYSANAAYAEGSYLITPHWRAALRYDWTKVDPDDADEVEESLLESTDIGVALNYIVNPNFVVKLAYHFVDGNRFTESDEEEEQDEKTGLLTAGVSFSF
jgi:hypothetical protein